MDLLIAGMPGPLLRWTCDLVAAAASLAARSAVQPAECAAVVADDPWMPPPEAERAPDTIRLFVAQHPSQAAIAAVCQDRLAALLVIDDPALALRELLRVGLSRDTIIRSLSASVTVLGQAAGSRSALIVTRHPGQAVRPLLDRVLTHLGVAMPPADAAQLAARFGAGQSAAEAVLRPPHDSGELPQEDAALVHTALAPACRYAATGQRTAIVWPRACLFWGDRPGEPAPRVLDLTGPSRVLVYGPYFRLPPGRWTARAIVAFSPLCRGMGFTVELHGSAEFGRRRFVVQQAGVFAIGFRVMVPSAREALEIRLVSQSGAIEGNLGIDRIEFVPAAN
jgi:hypothetical protein